MKTIILTIVNLISIVYYLSAQSPLKADAGNDTNYCFKPATYYSEKIFLGGKITASGGIKPYKYDWTMYSKSTKKDYTLLADSGFNHNANISFIFPYYNDNFIFKVTVKDSVGTTVSDSVTIAVSMMWNGCIIMNDSMVNDSFQLNIPYCEGGIQPFIYSWKPTTGLSNAAIQNPKAKPLVSTDYIVSVTDNVGCKYIDCGLYQIVVTDIDEQSIGFIRFANPVLNTGTMKFTSNILGSTFLINSDVGIVLYTTIIEKECIPLGSLIPTAGIYFYRLITPQGKLITGRFVRE
jgi:hypothetical protein